MFQSKTYTELVCSRFLFFNKNVASWEITFVHELYGLLHIIWTILKLWGILLWHSCYLELSVSEGQLITNHPKFPEKQRRDSEIRQLT